MDLNPPSEQKNRAIRIYNDAVSSMELRFLLLLLLLFRMREKILIDTAKCIQNEC